MGFFLRRLSRNSVFAFILVCACAQTSETKVDPPISVADLKAEVVSMGNDPVLKYGNWAVSIQSTKTGAILLEHNTRKSMVIASNLKVVTTATALAMLGEDYQFTTELQYDGTLQPDGTLNGNIYIKGGGDPTLGSDEVKGSLPFRELMTLWVSKIKAAGIKKVNGMVVGDSDIFNENVVPGGWTWADLGNYYGSPAFGLNINDNLYRLVFAPSAKVGDPARILRTEPEMHAMEFVNEVITGPAGSGDNAYIYGAPYTDIRYVQGSVPGGVKTFTIKGAVTDPPLLCAELLHDQLMASGVVIDKLPATSRLLRQRKSWKEAGRMSIYLHQSPPLREIVAHTNLQSVNLYAEAMVKALGIVTYKDGTTFSGTTVVENFWKEKGVDTGGFFMRDGSGLSRTNAITAATLTGVLQYSAKQPYFNALYESFPVAGISGTMKNMGKGTLAEGNFRAKTGTIERVTSYSGYFRTKSGELMAFAIIANDYDGESRTIRRRIEKLMGMMAGLP